MQKVTRGLQIVASLGILMQMKTTSKSTFVTLILQKGSRVLQIVPGDIQSLVKVNDSYLIINIDFR
jgi:hypothetical protein